MKQPLFIFILILAVRYASAQGIGFLITNDDEKVEVYKSISIDALTVKTYNAKGKSVTFDNRKVKRVSVSGREFLSLAVNKKGDKRLQEIIARNDDYILTDYFIDDHYIFIFDLQGQAVVGKTKYNTFSKSDKVEIIEVIKKYFENCPVMLEKLEENAEDKKAKLFDGIGNFECD
jgi:hypothetical protein